MKILYKFFYNMRKGLTRGEDIQKIDYRTLQNLMKENGNIILLDVRSRKEFCEGHLLGAINIPLCELKNKINFLVPNKGQTIIVYCQMGGRSEKAGRMLKRMGYINIFELDGGLDGI